MHVYVYEHISIYLSIHIHIYIHTHTYIYVYPGFRAAAARGRVAKRVGSSGQKITHQKCVITTTNHNDDNIRQSEISFENAAESPLENSTGNPLEK